TTRRPARHAMSTTPGAWLADLYLLCSRMHQHIAFESADLETIAWCAMLDEVGQELISPGLMVPIQFTIGRNHNQLRFSRLALALYKVFGQVRRRENVGVIGDVPIERDATGKRCIIKENCNTASITQRYDIRLCGIYRRRSLPGS